MISMSSNLDDHSQNVKQTRQTLQSKQSLAATASWDAEAEGNKLILLFEGYIYGDASVSEGMVVAAINRFRTKQTIELNPDWQADRG